MPLNITIDGPVGAGKSTVADEIAKRLSILHLDTGAMYRAFAYFCIEKGISVEDELAVAAIIDEVEISVAFSNGKQKTLLNGTAVDDYIRTPEVSMAASTLSKMGIVREKLVKEQRKIAKTRDMVLDGRDTGTNVLTDAEVKIYLTASPETRANRRFKQNLSTNSYEEILAAVIKRDYQDSNRALNPLKKADDAHLLDSSNMSLDEVVESILQIVRNSK